MKKQAPVSQVPHASRNPLLPLFQPRLGLAADAFDLDRVGALKAGAVEDLPDAGEIDRPPSPTAGKYQSS